VASEAALFLESEAALAHKPVLSQLLCPLASDTLDEDAVCIRICAHDLGDVLLCDWLCGSHVWMVTVCLQPPGATAALCAVGCEMFEHSLIKGTESIWMSWVTLGGMSWQGPSRSSVVQLHFRSCVLTSGMGAG